MRPESQADAVWEGLMADWMVEDSSCGLERELKSVV